MAGIHNTSMQIWSHSVHFSVLDGLKIRPPAQRTGLEVFAVELLQKLGLGVKVFLHFWKNKWNVQTHLDLPDVSCVEGQPLKGRIHLLNTHRNEKHCHSLVGENRERKQMRSRFCH